MKRWYVYTIVGVIVVFVLSSYLSILFINRTSEPSSCAECHTMKPMVESFSMSIHGGNNALGFRVAHCTDCHLPQTSTFSYLMTKGIVGTRDILSEIGLSGKVDFKRIYFDYDNYVYDSGCLKCHSGIKNPSKAYGMDPDIRQVHKYYWQEKKAGSNIRCVDCHNDYNTPNFAHPGLLQMLSSK